MRRLRTDKRGATAIEYGLLVALISIAMMGGLKTLGGGAGGMWTKIATKPRSSHVSLRFVSELRSVCLSVRSVRVP
jgi:pilus assembly protein Flp/PilA